MSIRSLYELPRVLAFALAGLSQAQDYSNEHWGKVIRGLGVTVN